MKHRPRFVIACAGGGGLSILDTEAKPFAQHCIIVPADGSDYGRTPFHLAMDEARIGDDDAEKKARMSFEKHVAKAQKICDLMNKDEDLKVGMQVNG